MFLKRIEIYGFKSFAGRSVLDFEYSDKGNITAVVGPNGSGKSNVADAIRWVTGEQSTKNLRSKKSEDVIFCGSAAKSRASYAEVSIILADSKPFKFELNNKEHTLTEIEVSRKLYRSGESEYLINHKKVRLTDIQQLLASLGFGQSSYTVIGQGMVDRLLFFTASERKVLFDEAAGVKQYEIKREQAIRKLESTDANLIRLRDILAELTPRVTNLRRLVKRAEGRKEFEVELVESQQKYFGSLYSEYTDTIAGTESKKSELNKKVVQIEQKIVELRQKLESRRENPHTAERRSLEGKITVCTSERDKLMRDVSYLSGQIESLGRNQSLITDKKNRLEAERTSLTEKIEFLSSKLKTERQSLVTVTENKEKLGLPAEKLFAEMQVVEKELQSPIDQKAGHIDELKKRVNSLTTQKLAGETAKVRLEELEKLRKLLESEIKEAKAEQKTVQNDADKLQAELETLELEVKKLSSLVNPSVLAEVESAIVEVEKTPTTGKDFLGKLNKLFVQFRQISKAINNEERERLDSKLSTIRRDARVTTDKLVSLRVLLGTKESRLSTVQTEMESCSATIAASNIGEEDIATLQQEIAKYEGNASERQNVLLRQKDAIASKLSAARDALHVAELEYNRLSTLVSNQETELASAERRLAILAEELSSLGTNEADSSNSGLEDTLKSTEKELNRKEEDLAKLRGGLTQVISAEREAEQAGMAHERERRLLEDEKSGISAQIASLEVEAAKTQVRLEDLNEEMRLGRISLKEGTNYHYLDQMEKDVLKLKMENLRRKLETIGGVDPETEAEYQELETRESEMSAQVEDLTKAKLDLEKVVTELDVRIKNQFADVFKNISTEFSRYFSMLFGGGSAALNLGEDEEGSFGIEISANPPGKRVTSLNALSGGERTLTSLALLFAILSVNPSPFCVLDEVDAALDESNTLRFVKILGDLAHKTQFIIISHNRDTMKVASSLYGVTMNDEHVSKLLSVKLTEALVAAK